MITSTKNAKIKEVRALQGRAKARRTAGAFVVEGVRLAEEALAAGWQPQLVLYTEELDERGQTVVGAFTEQGALVEIVAAHVMEAASDTQSPQGILLVLPLAPLPLPPQLDFVLILDQVRDPGNLGTLLRGATAARADAVLLTEGSVDPFAPKVVRSGMGAHFRLPVHTLDITQLSEVCQAHGLAVYLAAAGGGQVHTALDLTEPIGLAVGGEAAGHSTALQALAAEQVHIPMPGGGESLNAAMAGTILLFEVVRQRA